MTTTWALIADRNHASIFKTKGRRKELELVERVTRVDDASIPHGIEPVIEANAEHFAHELAVKLKHAHERHEFEQLVLAAPPTFLGMLRKVIDPVTARTIVGEVHKHLGGPGDGNLAAHLAPTIPL